MNKKIMALGILFFVLFHFYVYFGFDFDLQNLNIGKTSIETDEYRVDLKEAIVQKTGVDSLQCKALGLEPQVIVTFKSARAKTLSLAMINLHPDRTTIEQSDALSNVLQFGQGLSCEIEPRLRPIRIQFKHASEENFSFMVCSDPGGMDSPFSNSRGTYFIFNRMVQDAYLHKDLFLFINGDLMNRGRYIEYIRLRKRLSTLKIPCFATVGNHDLIEAGASANWTRLFGPEQAAFTYKNCAFIYFNDNDRIADNTFVWLDQALAANQGKNIFLFIHVPPINVDNHPRYIVRDPAERKFLINLIQKYKPAIVFSGHYHGLVDRVEDNIRYIVTGGGGSKLRANQFYHAIRVNVSKAGITYDIIKLNNLPTPSWLLFVFLNFLYLLLVSFLSFKF